MSKNDNEQSEPVEEDFVYESSYDGDSAPEEAIQPERDLVSAKSAFSTTIPSEVYEYQQRLEAAPSALTVFVDFENYEMNVLSNNGYEDEEQAILDYYEDCANADFVPNRDVIQQIRGTSEWLKIRHYLSRAGAYALRRICNRFYKIDMYYANLSASGLLEIAKALTKLSDAQILSNTQEEFPPSDNKLQVLKIIECGIAAGSYLVSAMLPGLSPQLLQASYLQAQFNLNVNYESGRSAGQPAQYQPAALLNFNSNVPRRFYQEAPADKGKAPVYAVPAALGDAISFPILMKNLNLTRVNPTAMCLQRIVETCKVLEELDLSSNSLGDETCLQLCAALERSQITTLRLSGNELTDQFLRQVPGFLAYSVVQELCVRANHFTSAGAICFASFLAEKKGYFERLDIGCNNIGDLGCVALLALSCGTGFCSSDIFQQASSIFAAYAGAKGTIMPKKLPYSGYGDFHSISIASCSAGIITAVYIVATLRDAANIDFLDVSGNQFADAGWYSIMKALAQRATQPGLIGTFRITFYRFVRSDMLPEDADSIETILEKVQKLGPKQIKTLDVLK